MTDPIDEYLTQNLTEYEDKKFQNASKDDLKIGSKDEKAKLKEIKESFKVLTKWWKDLVGGEHVESVKVYRLTLYRMDRINFQDSSFFCHVSILHVTGPHPSKLASVVRTNESWLLKAVTEQDSIVGLFVYGLGEQPFGKHTRCGGDIKVWMVSQYGENYASTDIS